MPKIDIALEFDGVLHAGTLADSPGQPVPGIIQAIRFMQSNGTTLCVFSERAEEAQGRSLISVWLAAHEVTDIPLYVNPHGAKCVVSANGFRFDGNASGLLVVLSLGIPEPWFRHDKLRMVPPGIESIAQAHNAIQSGAARPEPGTDRMKAIREYADAGASFAALIDFEMNELQRELEESERAT